MGEMPSYSGRKVTELKCLLQGRGLRVRSSDKKDDLIRLLKNDDLVMSSCRENNGIVVDRKRKRRNVNDVGSGVVRTTDKVVNATDDDDEITFGAAISPTVTKGESKVKHRNVNDGISGVATTTDNVYHATDSDEIKMLKLQIKIETAKLRQLELQMGISPWSIPEMPGVQSCELISSKSYDKSRTQNLQCAGGKMETASTSKVTTEKTVSQSRNSNSRKHVNGA